MKKKVIVKPKSLSLATPVKTDYETDFYKWTQIQANRLKEGDYSHLDLINLVEEIESLGKTEKRALKSHLINLFMHMLKQEYQPEMQKNSNSWKASISNARREVKLLLEDSPSLSNDLKKNFVDAYRIAKEDAANETGIDISEFPDDCPWTILDLFPSG